MVLSSYIKAVLFSGTLWVRRFPPPSWKKCLVSLISVQTTW